MQLKAALNRTPRLKRVLRRAKRLVVGPPRFDTSADYWEERYREGGNSGAGSYGRLAVFKADVLNKFVAENQIRTVIEIGCGDGAQLELAEYPSYVGVDVSRSVVDAARQRFGHDPSKKFLHTSEIADDGLAELALSLDVIYHLVEDDVFDAYMRQLFNAATRFVIVYSSNDDRPTTKPHVRHRKFTQWVTVNCGDFGLVQDITNPYPYSEKDPDNTSVADFYIFART